MTITFYRLKEPYGQFSNFWRKSPIWIDGVGYHSTEHYYQSQKFAGTDPVWQEEIRKAPTCREAADKGRDRTHPMRPDWEQVKEDVMRVALRAKFTQHEELRALLISTGSEEIVEHSTHDGYWGDGGDGTGKNRLGKLLMELRESIP
jgi:N-glycosidase YbiA